MPPVRRFRRAVFGYRLCQKRAIIPQVLMSGEKNMIRKFIVALLATAIALPAATVAARADDALQMVAIDVEGGGGTLFVTPHGKSVLIDTGNPERGDHPNSENIAMAAARLGVTKID